MAWQWVGLVSLVLIAFLIGHSIALMRVRRKSEKAETLWIDGFRYRVVPEREMQELEHAWRQLRAPLPVKLPPDVPAPRPLQSLSPIGGKTQKGPPGA